MSNIIIAYAPGSRGATLGKWLLVNNFVQAKGNHGKTIKQTATNHTFTPYYNDVLFCFNHSSEKTFKLIEQQLDDPESTIENITQLVNCSHDQVSSTGLILTHHASESGLYKLSQVLNATVIRVVFRDVQQARDAQIRKSQIENWPSNVSDHYLEKHYYPFINKFHFGIDITLDQINTFDFTELVRNLTA